MQQAVGIELNKFITLCTRTVLSFLIYRDLIIFNQKHFWRVTWRDSSIEINGI